MPSFRMMRAKRPIKGFQLHHLIPRQVTDASHFAMFFDELYAAGLNPHDFATNGMYLPNRDDVAMTFRLPIHRSSHPRYNSLVAEHVARMVGLPTAEALVAIGKLQADLRAALRLSHHAGVSIFRDPMNSALERDLEAIGLLGDARCRTTRIP